jgi:imidazoleglycerol phosphate synthase glutamine amidotransferase subunit HisH
MRWSGWTTLGLIEAVAGLPRPLLGVCLGQQLLFERSDEGGGVDLLGFIPGRGDEVRARPRPARAAHGLDPADTEEPTR